MIELRGITKRYDDKVAVDGIDLDVEQGSVCGLIGPNGAGKTTTLKMLATLIKPDSGNITVHGLDIVEDVRDVRRRIGYMPDAFGTFRGLTCEEYLEFFGRIHRFAGKTLASRVGDVLELTDLHAVRDQLTSSLSTGMKQRLSLAKTLLHDPEILLLDEPASGLDPRARIEIRSLLKELGRMGKTILISSHILSDLEEICTEVCLIDHGRAVWNGDLEKLASEREEQTTRCVIDLNESDVERAVETVATLEGVRILDSTARRIELELDGKIGNRVLRSLVSAEIEVQAFRLERPSLESLFLDRTEGSLS